MSIFFQQKRSTKKNLKNKDRRSTEKIEDRQKMVKRSTKKNKDRQKIKKIEDRQTEIDKKNIKIEFPKIDKKKDRQKRIDKQGSTKVLGKNAQN